MIGARAPPSRSYGITVTVAIFFTQGLLQVKIRCELWMTFHSVKHIILMAGNASKMFSAPHIVLLCGEWDVAHPASPPMHLLKHGSVLIFIHNPASNPPPHNEIWSTAIYLFISGLQLSITHSQPSRIKNQCNTVVRN